MSAIKAGLISLSLEFPEHEADHESIAPFIELNTMDLVDMAVDANAPAALVNAIHLSGQGVDFGALLLASIYEWAEEKDRLNAAAEIAEWLEAMAAELRRRERFPSLDLKPTREFRLG